MKTYFLIILFLFFCEETFAQSGLISPNGVSFPTYNSGTRPAANSVGTGTVLYNSTDNIHQFSNGSTWLNLLGTTSVPSGIANQTLRNNGSGWVADGLMQNTATKILIGQNFLYHNVLLDIFGTYQKGIQAESSSEVGIEGTSNTNAGLAGYSNTFHGVYARSVSGIGVYSESSTSYGGKFKGRIRCQKGGNGDAGIEFENSSLSQAGYIGMNGNTEMGIYGFGLGTWVERWNINTSTICYASTPTICSDIRLKKDFSNLSNSLSSISQLKGYNYYLRNEKNPNLQTGFIAQEIQKIFPELVQTGSDGYLSVDYVGLIPHLVESVKTLKNENEDLKERILKIEGFLSMNESKTEVKNSKK